MWFSLFATILILAVTFYQGLQGTFSALINCVLTVLAAMLAFGFYEDVYQWQLMAYQPDHGRAIALIAIFVISLLLLRTIVDKLITGNLRFPIYVDRTGGGIFGFITAMLIIGVLSIGFQMLPFGSTFLGFSRYSLVDQSGNKEVVSIARTLTPGRAVGDEEKDVAYRNEVNWANVRAERCNLWLNPDGFTVGLVSLLSNNALQGRNGFADLNPDFLDYLGDMRDGLARESLAALGPNAFSVKEYEYLRDNEPIYRRVVAPDETGNKVVKYELADRRPGPGKRWMVVTAEVREKTDKVQDSANLNFTAAQIRLLARESKDGQVVACLPVGISEDDPQNAHRLVELHRCQDIQYKRGEGGVTSMRLLFEVPDAPGFRPWMVQYKLNGRSEILPSQDRTDEKASSPASGGRDKTAGSDKPKTSGKPGDKTRPEPRPDKPDANTETTTPDNNTGGNSSPNTGGSPTPPANPNPPDRVHGVNLASTPPFFSNALPFRLTDYSEGPNFERAGSKLKGTHDLTAKLSDDWQPAEGSNPPLDAFDVPEDTRLLQVTVAQLHAESWLGNILQTATNEIRNIYLIDSNGKQYMPVGKYAVARISGQMLFELTYLDETERGFGRMPGFEHIKFRDLKDQYAYVFLFHVPPGTHATKFHTGRANIELTQFNLVAPK
jgi:uncharacterized membrane protein required for colicin V production